VRACSCVNFIDLSTGYGRAPDNVKVVDPDTEDGKLPAGGAPALRSSIESFYFAYRAFTSRADRLLERRGLGRLHHRVLYFVGRNPSITVNALLSILRVSKQALNAPLRQLIEMRLVSSVAPAHDRRVRQLALTAEGRRLEAQLTATQLKLLSQAFASAGDDATQGWIEVTRRIAGAAGRREG
jgi:DNA-binding MarR family transcriptional regulator